MGRFPRGRRLVSIAGLVLAAGIAVAIPLFRSPALAPGEAAPLPPLPGDAAWLEIASLGHRPLLADFLLARALVHYGAHYHDPGGPPAPAIHPWIAAAARLDPQNLDALLLGSNLLAEPAPRLSIDLLRSGNAAAPQEWRFPELIGFRYYFNLKSPFMAARYYEFAARLPGRPPYVPSLAGKFYTEAGRQREAVRVLAACRDQATDPRLKASFQRMIDQIGSGEGAPPPRTDRNQN